MGIPFPACCAGIHSVQTLHFSRYYSTKPDEAVAVVNAVAKYLRRELASMKQGTEVEVCEDNISEDFFYVVGGKEG